MKKFLSFIFALCLGLVIFYNTPNASAWIGTGTSGGGGGGGGWGGGCGGEIDKYGISCAGISWAFYKAQGSTNSWTEFPYINSNLRVHGASIPPECSKYPYNGFWHFGINSFGAYIVDGSLWTTTASWAQEYGSPWWGHWLTINPGNSAVSWAPYKTSGLGARQWVGPYQMDHYGSWNEALKAYQEAYVFDHPGAAKPTSIPDNVWGFCYGPGVKEATLTVKAIDTNGNSLSRYMADKSVKGSPGTPHSVTIGNINGYTKMYWGTSTNSSTWSYNTGLTYTENINANKTVYAVYQLNEYQGASQVAEVNANWGNISSSQKKSTGWTKTSKTVTQYINNCDPVNGCTAKFWHNLKRTAGLGSTSFYITRTSNYSTIGSGTVVSSRTETFPSSEINERTVAYVNKLYPGQVVCETMTFYTGTANGNASTTACAAALGNAQPSSTALLNIQVKNNDVAGYNTFRKEVYAKPGDRLTYQATYHPILQYAYNLRPQKMRINGGTIYPASGTNTTSTLGAMFNLYKGNLGNWNNSFTVFSANFTTAAFNQNYTFTSGSTTKQIKTNDHTTQNGEVGKSLDESAQTNRNNTTKTTPSQISFTNNSGNDLGNVITTQITDTASARVPYNFVNTTEITFDDANKPLYAGESSTIDFNIDVNPRQNNITNGNYATIVRNAKWKLEICYNGTCTWTSDKTGNLNTVGYSTTKKTESKQISINIPDVNAGTEICLRSAIYPANSGADINWQDAEGSHSWAYSSPKCFIVAKKPSLEIWGGNIYSRGKITTNTSNKGHLAGYNTYSPETKYTTHTFGSWTELGLISSGLVTGFSSGASLGFANNNNGILWPAYHPINGAGNNADIISLDATPPGGNTKTRLCDRSPLTFANSPCTNSVGLLGSSVSTNNTLGDKTSIISKYAYGGESNTPEVVTLNNPANLKTDNIYYYYGGSTDLTVPDSTIEPNTLQVVHTLKNLTITGDLIYTGNYTTLENTPKLILYAENDINIGCNVTRIDAILVASGNVKTCGESNDINAIVNSNQLTINGSVIANSLTANRTYGAATGANSMIPAEIINYDPTLYLWGSSKTEVESSTTNFNLDVTYQKDLAPRR